MKKYSIKEKWLFDNKTALKQVKKGLQDSAAGRIKSRNGFKKTTKSTKTSRID